MKLFITSAYATHTGLDALRLCAPLDTLGHHHLVTTAADADAILFVENTQFDDVFFKELLNHPLLAKYPAKTFMYNEMDRPWDLLPGLYCCMTRKRVNQKRHRAFAYLHTPNPYISEIHKEDVEPRWLYSFMGSMSHVCRRPIVRLKHEDGYVQDTSDFNVWRTDSAEMEVRGREYADIIADSQFVLCPRGIGTSSIRLYETLEAGRVPVIISDQWVPPAETDWGFAIQVQERQIASIPGILRGIIGEAKDRGIAARQAWLHSYAPHTLFNTVGDSIQSLLNLDTDDRSPKPGAHLHKWLTTGELLTRNAAQRLRGDY